MKARPEQHWIELIRTLEPGGAEALTHARHQAHEACDHNVRISLLHTSPHSPAFRFPSCTNIRGLGAWWPWKLWGQIRRSNATPIIVHSPSMMVIARAAAPKEVRLIQIHHGVQSSSSRIVRLLERRSRRSADIDVAVSTAVAARLKAEGTDAIVHIHWIDADCLRSTALSKRDARRRLAIDTDARLLMAVGNHRPQKDYASLIAAFEVVAASDPLAQLAIIGGGSQIAETKKLAAASETGERIAILGPIPDAARLMRAADVFVMSSVAEGLPVVLMEAVSLGIPVVATDAGGCSQVIELGAPADGAILVEPSRPDLLADALKEILQRRPAEPGHGAPTCSPTKSADFYLQLGQQALTSVSGQR